MKWHDYEKRGWSWAIGWNPNYGGYYAQAWRRFPKRVRLDGRWSYRDCVIEGGQTLAEAQTNLWQRLDGIDGLTT